jgi:hypothetical protein
MNAVQFLLEEHQTVKRRFAEIEQASGAERLTLWRKLEPELKIHEQIEDTYLFGPISKEPAASGTKAGGFVDHQDKDVAELDQKIHKLHQLDAADAEWLAQLEEIKDALMDHVREEEEEILPQIQQIWDRSKLEMAGQQMAAAKQEAMTNPHHYATMMSQATTQSGGVAGAVGRMVENVKDAITGQ